MHRMIQSIKSGPRPFRFTRDQYYSAAELGFFNERRVQLIEGEIIEMSPQGSPHAKTIEFVDDALRAAFGSGYRFRVQSPLSLGLDSEPEPDVSVVRGSAREAPDGHPETAVLVVEIADSSLILDTGRKAALYARAGISEYWIVNLVDARLDVYRNPTVDARFEFGAVYAEIRGFSADASVTPLAAPAASIRVSDLLP